MLWTPSVLFCSADAWFCIRTRIRSRGSAFPDMALRGRCFLKLGSKVFCNDASRGKNIARETQSQLKPRLPLKMSLPLVAEVLTSSRDVDDCLRTSQPLSHGPTEVAHQDRNLTLNKQSLRT